MSPGPTKHISYPKGGLEMMDLLNKIKLLGQNFLPSRTSPKLLKVLTERLLTRLAEIQITGGKNVFEWQFWNGHKSVLHITNDAMASDFHCHMVEVLRPAFPDLHGSLRTL